MTTVASTAVTRVVEQILPALAGDPQFSDMVVHEAKARGAAAPLEVPTRTNGKALYKKAISPLLLGSARGAASLPSHKTITTEVCRRIAKGNSPTGS